jgi:hypothetical protein
MDRLGTSHSQPALSSLRSLIRQRRQGREPSMSRRSTGQGKFMIFGLFSLFLLFGNLEAKDKDSSLAKLKGEFKIERARLDEAYTEKNPPSTDGKAYEKAKKILLKIAALSSREAAYFLIETLKVKVKNPELQLEAFRAQREALGALKAGSAGYTLVKYKVRRKDDWRERVDLIYALRHSKSEATDGILLKIIKDKRVAVAGAAIRSLGFRKAVSAIPTLIKLMQKHEAKKNRLWLDIRHTLTAITGFDTGSSREWKKKWSELDKAGFDPKANRGKDKFYYPKNFILSQRVVMVLDTSGSMHIRDPKGGEKPGLSAGVCRTCQQSHGGTDEPKERERLFRGKKYMQSLLQTLRKGARFNIVHFNQKGRTWQTDGLLISVADGAIETALDYLDGYKPEGASNSYSGFKRAFSASEMDTIIYMSDGFSTNKVGDRLPYLKALAQIRNLNRYRNARIFSIGFKGTAREFMKKLAAQNGGSLHEID